MARPKNQPVKPVGRPPILYVGERQAVMRRELLNVVKPYFKLAMEQIARIAGIAENNNEEKDTLSIQQEDTKNYKEVISANTQLAACKVIVDTYKEGLKETYPKEGGNTSEEEITPPAPASVSRLSLTVAPPQTKN